MRATHETKARTSSSAPPTFTPLPRGLLQRKCACGGTPGSSGECESCRKKKLQRRAENPDLSSISHPPSSVLEVPPIVHEVLRSPGQPLDPKTRAFMEPRFGHDFSNVRVHLDAKAAESARAVHAFAYTMGRDMVFGSGQFAPGTDRGGRLIAHELTHVMQQGTGRSFQRYSLSDVHDSFEQEASACAEAVVNGRPVPAVSQATGLLQRQDAGVPADARPGPAAPPAGLGATPAPAPVAAADPLDGLIATQKTFKTSGAFDADDCAVSRAASLGVGIGGTATNSMELSFELNKAAPAGTEFDVLRTVTDTSWERSAAGAWSRLLHTPAGTNDDHTNDDECLVPSPRRLIYDTDSPGWGGLNPQGLDIPGGVKVAATATAFVIKLSFASWVIARNRALGAGWRTITDPTFTFWHSINSVALVGGAWTLANTPSGQANEITLGSVSTAGATP